MPSQGQGLRLLSYSKNKVDRNKPPVYAHRKSLRNTSHWSYVNCGPPWITWQHTSFLDFAPTRHNEWIPCSSRDNMGGGGIIHIASC